MGAWGPALPDGWAIGDIAAVIDLKGYCKYGMNISLCSCDLRKRGSSDRGVRHAAPRGLLSPRPPKPTQGQNHRSGGRGFTLLACRPGSVA